MDLEDDLDTHICLRCQTTIIGLDLYVNHKKQECPALKKTSPVSTSNQRPVTTLSQTRSNVQSNIGPSIEQTGSFHENSLSDFHLRQDDFFSSLELQCKISPVKPAGAPASPSVRNSQGTWKETSVGVNLNIADLEFGNVDHGKTDDPELDHSEDDGDFDFIQDVSGNDDSEDELRPPNCHTGGKWKPGTHPLPNRDGKWNTLQSNSPSPPPATYTKGKWLPGKRKIDHNYVSAEIEVDGELDKNESSKETYNCDLCNKKLSCKYALFRHVNTPYHMKRAAEGVEKENANKNSSPELTSVNNRSKRIRKPSRLLLAMKESQNKKVKNTSLMMECRPCKRAFHFKRNFAQHLCSSLHAKRAENHPDRYDLIFENMDILTKQAPFQCGVCSFYFNHHEYFLKHWSSQSHMSSVEKMLGPFVCMSCNYVCEKNEEMHSHILGEEHHEVVLTVNKSQPIVIKEKRSELKCKCCNTLFATAFAFKKHQKSAVHQKKLQPKTESKTLVCSVCNWKTLSYSNLKIHMRRRHTKEKPFKCSPCGKAFCDNGSLRVHELTIRHKRRLVAAELSIPNLTCSFCKESETFKALIDLKEHIKTSHPNKIITCDRCKGIFVLEVEYKIHFCKKTLQNGVNKNSRNSVTQEKCSNEKAKTIADSKVHKCSKCSFTCKSKSKFVYHEILHQLPEKVAIIKKLSLTDGKESIEELSAVNEEDAIKSKSTNNLSLRMVKMYRCPYCKKAYPKAALQDHLNIHTGEKPYKCNLCDKAFAQNATLYIHEKRHMGLKKFKCDKCNFAAERPSRLERHKLIHGDRLRAFKCDICGNGYHDRWTLKHHMKLHLGKEFKCPHEGCSQAFRCKSELNTHMRVHTNEKPFLCDQCGYAGRSQHQLTKHRRSHTGERPFKCKYCSYSAHLSPHLLRHMRIHTGAKPYKCPYCNYTCNTQENIRKHILKTKKHQGMKMYPCRFCDYGCNTATEYKAHILENHEKLVSTQDIDVVSLIAGVYKRINDDNFASVPIPYIPREERLKNKDRTKNEVKKSTAKKARKEQPILNPPEDIQFPKDSDQVVYAIQVPGKINIMEAATDQVFQPISTNRETILLPISSISADADGLPESTNIASDIQSEHATEIYIPAETEMNAEVQNSLHDPNIMENNSNTIFIYMPIT